MCGEHQLLQHLATTHGNKRACFLLQRSFQPPPPFPPASALLTKKTALWPCDLGFAVELREAEEQGCVVGGTVWPAVRREARVLHLWVQ